MPKLAWEVKALCLRLADNAESKPPSLYEQPAQYASDTHSPSSSLPVGRPEDTGRPGRTADVAWRGILSNRQAQCSVLRYWGQHSKSQQHTHARTHKHDEHTGAGCAGTTARPAEAHRAICTYTVHRTPYKVRPEQQKLAAWDTTSHATRYPMRHGIPCDTVSHAMQYLAAVQRRSSPRFFAPFASTPKLVCLEPQYLCTISTGHQHHQRLQGQCVAWMLTMPLRRYESPM